MRLEHTLTPYTKMNSKWLKDLSQDIINFWKRTFCKTFSDVNCMNIFLIQPPKAIDIKAKIDK